MRAVVIWHDVIGWSRRLGRIRRLRVDALARTLAERLQDDFLVVTSPDHPMLLDAPDLLLASPGNLVAVFLPRERERNFPEDLLVRLALARLALPRNLRTVLVLPGEDYEVGGTDVSDRHFDAVAGLRSTRELKALVRDREARRESDSVPPELRTQILHRFEVHFGEARKNLSASSEGDGLEGLYSLHGTRATGNNVSTTALLSHLREQEEFAPLHRFYRAHFPGRHRPRSVRYERQLVRQDEIIVGGMTFEGRSSPMEALKQICRSVFRLNFAVDNGVPYPVDPTANVLAVDQVPLGRFDFEKPIRAAAFAGWSMAEVLEPESVLGVADRLRLRLLGAADR